MKNVPIMITIVLVVGVLVGVTFFMEKKEASVVPASPDIKNTSYVIEGQEVMLQDGKSENESAPGSDTKITTEYFGNELVVDVDSDGKLDTVFLVTQNTGGTGTFYYVVAGINKGAGFAGSDGYPLGDRIAPQSIEVSQNPAHQNVIVVNYAERAPGEAMTVPPSVGKSVYLKLDPASRQWGIVEANFAGEADPAVMTLPMKTWTWVRSQSGDLTSSPSSTEAFTLTFDTDGTFTASTDCNSVGGSYSTHANSVDFTNIYRTEMYCEGSQEGEFVTLLENTKGYHFTSKGELVLELTFDRGSAVFK